MPAVCQAVLYAMGTQQGADEDALRELMFQMSGGRG